MADRRALAALLGLTALAGCSMAPPYQPPAVSVPATYAEAGSWTPAAPGDAAPSQTWWTAFGDSTLDALETRLATDNPSLAVAAGRYDLARAYLAEVRAGLFPQIGAQATVTQNRQSDNRPLRGQKQPDLYAADTLGAQVSYEADLWGRVRNSVAAGRADAEASADDLAAVRVSLQAQLATDYIALRGYDREIDLLQRTVDAYSRADAMTRRRFAGGIANGMETGQSATQLAEAQGQLADLRNARALTEHAIAALVGTTPSGFSIAASSAPLPMPEVPVSLPSTLLQRRPDVAAAERRMFAANRRIGVAKAAFFPSLLLGGQGGVQNTALAGLASAPNLFWSVGPNVLLTLFDGGRNRARVAEARAGWEQATADYRLRVLGAMQDVEDGLSRLHHLGDEAAAEERAAQQAAQVEQLATRRYEKGAVSYLDVVTAQTTALRTQRQAIEIDTRRQQATVGLFKAVGGGWA